MMNKLGRSDIKKKQYVHIYCLSWAPSMLDPNPSSMNVTGPSHQDIFCQSCKECGCSDLWCDVRFGRFQGTNQRLIGYQLKPWNTKLVNQIWNLGNKTWHFQIVLEVEVYFDASNLLGEWGFVSPFGILDATWWEIKSDWISSKSLVWV